MPKRAKTDDPDWEKSPAKKDRKARQKSCSKSVPADPVEGTSKLVRAKREGKDGVLFGKDCIFCRKEEPIKVKQEKQYPTKFKSDGYKSVVEKARELDDVELMCRIDGVDLFAAEAHFHKRCRSGYLVHRKKDTESDYTEELCAHNHALEAVVMQIQNDVVKGDKIVTLRSLADSYKADLSHSNFMNEDVVPSLIRRKLEKHDISKKIAFASAPLRPTLIYSKDTNVTALVRSAYDLGHKDLGKDVAIQLHDNIVTSFESKDPLPWPTRPKDIPDPKDEVPKEVMDHVLNLISPSGKHTDKSRRLGLSIAQDICRAVTNCEWKMEKHIILCMTIRHLFRDKDFMTILNRLGHCESYTYSLELETALANAVMQSGSLLNSKIVKNPDQNAPVPGGVFHSWWDNFDKNTKGGSIHTAQGLYAQEVGDMQDIPEGIGDIIEQPKNKKRSLELTIQNPLQPYYSKVKVGPVDIPDIEVPKALISSDIYNETMDINMIWMLARVLMQAQQKLPGISGFVSVTGYMPKKLTTIGYFPMINHPITENATVQECLRLSEEATREVGQLYVITTFDLGVCMRAFPMVWASPDRYKNHIILLGTFHICCAYLKAIGKKMAGSGLDDILREANIMKSTGSINSILAGSNYEMGLFCHKAVLECLERMLYEKYQEQNDPLTDEAMANIHSLQESPCGRTLQVLMANDEVRSHIESYMEFKRRLREGLLGSTPQLWISYADHLWLLLQFISAIKRNDYDTYLACIKAMPDLFFAMDMQNYARYLTYFGEFLANVEATHPGAEELLRNGAISAARSFTPGSRAQIDKTGEETIMKHTKASSGPGTAAAGLSGIEGNPEAYQRHIVTIHERATYVEAALRMAGVFDDDEKDGKHKDLRPSEIRKSEMRVQEVGRAFNSFTHPFHIDDKRLICLASGAAANEKVRASLLSSEKLGKMKKEEFITDRIKTKTTPFFKPISRNNVKTMADRAVVKKMKSSTNQVVQYKATTSIVLQLFVQSQVLGMHVSTAELMKYPLTTTPYAIATVDGHFAKTNKAQCMNKIISDEEDAEMPPVQETCAIVDGNATFYMKDVPPRMGLVADKVKKMMPRASEVVFSTDSYAEGSIKDSERQRRGCGEKFIIKGEQTKQPADWTGFLSNAENKKQLIHLISEKWKHDVIAPDDCPIIFIENGQATRMSIEGVERIPELDSSQEETDTRVILYVGYAQDKGHNYVRVKTKDSDIFFLLLHYGKQFEIQIIFDNGSRLVNVSHITEQNTQEWCTAMMTLHCFTGCDTTSAFKGKGKVKPFNALQKSTKFLPVFAKLGSEWEVEEDVMNKLEEFTCLLYGHKRMKKVDEVREVKLKKLCGKDGSIKPTSLDLGYFPPCQRSLIQHTKRVNYTAAIGRRSHLAKETIPPPVPGHGWVISEETGIAEPLWFEGNTIPQTLLDILAGNLEADAGEQDEDVYDDIYDQSDYGSDDDDEGND